MLHHHDNIVEYPFVPACVPFSVPTFLLKLFVSVACLMSLQEILEPQGPKSRTSPPRCTAVSLVGMRNENQQRLILYQPRQQGDQTGQCHCREMVVVTCRGETETKDLQSLDWFKGKSTENHFFKPLNMVVFL